MNRDNLKREIEIFEEKCAKVSPPSPFLLLFPIVHVILFIKYLLAKPKLKGYYKEVSDLLESMKNDLDPKEYYGWKMRIDSAYKS